MPFFVSFERLSAARWRQEHRERELAQTRAEAALCDCWKFSGPLCAKCKLRQHQRELERLDAERQP